MMYVYVIKAIGNTGYIGRNIWDLKNTQIKFPEIKKKLNRINR